MKDYRTKTIEFYDKEADRYEKERNVILGFEDIYKPFIKLIKPGGLILDFGCGSGRDSLYFLNKGYKVKAIDGSSKMCQITRELCNIEVEEMFFEDFRENDVYDGIWACASLLHLPENTLIEVLNNLSNALKENGYIYVSFKYGEFLGMRHERYFHDFSEETFKEILKNVPSLEIEYVYYTDGLLKEQINKKWINIILKKRKD